MSWGNWIVVSFILFAIFIGTLVTVCVRQDINLVTPDYYNQEMTFQKQIERKRNAGLLEKQPSVSLQKDGTVTLHFSLLSKVEKGELKLHRPSNSRLDQKFSFQGGSDSLLVFKLIHPTEGFYRAQVRWSMEGKEYFTEKGIVL